MVATVDGTTVVEVVTTTLVEVDAGAVGASVAGSVAWVLLSGVLATRVGPPDVHAVKVAPITTTTTTTATRINANCTSPV